VIFVMPVCERGLRPRACCCSPCEGLRAAGLDETAGERGGHAVRDIDREQAALRAMLARLNRSSSGWSLLF